MSLLYTLQNIEQGLTLTFGTTFHFGEYIRFQNLLPISESHFPKWITVLKSVTAEIKMFLDTVNVLFDLIEKPQSNMAHSVSMCDFFV